MENFRPPAEARKINCKDDFELCYLRHQYLRKVDYNPTPEQMKPYQRIIEYMSRNTYYTYRYLFSTIGMGLEDIISTSRVHIVSFVGLFEFDQVRNREEYDSFVIAFGKNRKTLGLYPTDKDVMDKNKANFTLFMKQRMEDLVRICKQKAKNIKGFKVDEYVPFYGPEAPPEHLHKLLEDHEVYGYRKCDAVAFKAIKKRMKAEIGVPFQFSGNWYIAVPLEQRNLTILDLAGAGLDPGESEHNMNPEEILLQRHKEKKLDIKRKVYKNYSREEKAKVILGFIEKNEGNPFFEEEINIAKRFLREMSARNVR